MRTSLLVLATALAFTGCGNDKKAKPKKDAAAKDDAATDKLIEQQAKKRDEKAGKSSAGEG